MPDPPEQDNGPTGEQIARIDALTATGRANWLALLAYLAFVLITTLGVQDIDFFVDSRQTQLPLVNVSIPTFSFFIFAPILGAALYSYLHLHIRKVTEALAQTPTSTPMLEERIRPWLLNDYVLLHRSPRKNQEDADKHAIRRRPMDWLVLLTTLLLVWWAGPVVLGVMWVRTWPAHELWLSLLCALCLMITLYAGAMSWTKMRQDLGRRGGWATLATSALILLLALPVIWLTLANSKGIWEWGIELPDDANAPLSSVQRIEKWARGEKLARDAIEQHSITFPEHAALWMWTVLTDLARLDAPDMIAARLAVLPPDEADPEAARHRYRKEFCARRGMDAEICDLPQSVSYTPPIHLAGKRVEWCEKRGYVQNGRESCKGFFSRLDNEFDAEWRSYRSALIASISKPSFASHDLRRVKLNVSEIAGLDFSGSQMQGANLNGAQMQGANFIKAQMQGAEVSHAQMQGADLSWAEIQGADLRYAQMQEVLFNGAQMQEADLSWAEIQKANLRGVRMQGATLSEAQIQEADFSRARMQGVRLNGAQMQGVRLNGAQMQEAFLRHAQMQGVDLSEANLQFADWTLTSTHSVLARSADFRSGEGLTQALLSSMIGDGRTLLPDTPAPDTGEPFYIPDCWTEPPEGWDSLVAALAHRGNGRDGVTGRMTENAISTELLCTGVQPRKTGTPWPVDIPPPWEAGPE